MRRSLCIAALVAAAPGGAHALGTTTASASGAHPYTASLGVEFRMLAVSDEDPANDRGLYYRGQLAWKITPELGGFIRAGVTQGFVQVGTAPAVRFQDMLIGATYSVPVEVAGEEVGLHARLGLYLPTSRASQKQTLYAAPDVSLSASWSPAEWLELQAAVLGQYRFVQFAERAGPAAPLNTQLVLGGSLGAEAMAWEDGDQRLVLGVSLSTNLRKRYEAADVFASALSDATYWDQLYGWSAYAAWTPLSWLTATVGLEQGGPVLRDGIVNVFFTKLEETELVVGLAARY